MALWLATAQVSGAEAPSSSSDQTIEDAEARRVAEEVFAGERYWWKRSTELETPSFARRVLRFLDEDILQPILNWLKDVLEWLLEKLLGGLHLGNWSEGIPLLWVVVAGLGLFAGWRLMAAYKARPAAAADARAGDALESLPQATELLARAQAALTVGDGRAAVRWAFLAILAALQDRGRLRYDPSRSNREYDADLIDWPELQRDFRQAARPFERSWYGGRPLNAREAADVVALSGAHLARTGGAG